MQRKSFAGMACSLAGTLEIIGDTWSLLVLRDIGMGITRFSAIQRDLDISRRTLTEKLTALEAAGILQREAYQERPVRYDYVLTEKGTELAMVLLLLQSWGDRWVFTETGAPVLWRHLTCGEVVRPRLDCASCGEPLRPGEAVPFAGPGHDPGPGTSESPAALARFQALFGVGPDGLPVS